MSNKIAPSASDRYFLAKIKHKKSPLSGGILDDGNLPKTTIIIGNDGDFFHDASQITRTILKGDTAYEEKTRRLKFIPVEGRKASSKDKDKTEYNILNKRFNIGYLNGINRYLLTYPKYQQGGQLNMDEQQLQQQIIQLVLAAMSGNKEAAKQIEQIMLAAQQGDLQAVQLAQMILAVALELAQQQLAPSQTAMARFGAKLNYVKSLRGQCPEGYEMGYFKKGGLMVRGCKECDKKLKTGGNVPYNPIEEFKCGRKTKKKKCEIGGTVEKDKCGKKMECDKCGSKLKKKEVIKAKGGLAGIRKVNIAEELAALNKAQNDYYRQKAEENEVTWNPLSWAKEAYYRAKSNSWLLGEDENPATATALTGIAPAPSTTPMFKGFPKGFDLRKVWDAIKSAGKWGKKPAFKPGYRGTTTYNGGYGALQGNVFLPNNAKIGGGPSNASKLEELVYKGLQEDFLKGRIPSEYQLNKAINQRLNNLYRLSDEDIAEMMRFSENNENLFNSRFLLLIKGHTGRVLLGTR